MAPKLPRGLGDLPGVRGLQVLGEDIGSALTTFAAAAKSGLLGDAIKAKALQAFPGELPTTRRAAPAAPGARPTVYQPTLPSPRGPRGQFESIYGKPARYKGDVDYEMAVRGQPSIEDVKRTEQALAALRPPRVAPGQLDLFGAPEPQFKTIARNEPPMNEAAADLYQNDPGTFKTLDQLAQRATAYYGRPVTVNDLTSPNAGRFLQELEAGKQGGALARTGSGGQMVPPAGRGELAPFERGGNLTESQRGALVRSGTQPGVDEFIEANVREVRNAAGGLRTVDLRRQALLDEAITKNLSRGQLAGIAGLTALGTAALTSQLMGGREPGEPTDSVDPGAASMPPIAPPATQNPGTLGIPGAAATAVTGAAGTPAAFAGAPSAYGAPTPGMTGGGQVVIRQNDSASNLLQALQNAKAGSQTAFAPGAPSEYKKIADYYAARERFASQPKAAEQVRDQLVLEGALDNNALLKWAEKNPTLAYELLQKERGMRRMPSQQTPQVETYKLGTSLGTNNVNNPIGNAAAASEAAVTGSQGAADLKAATMPQVYPELNRFDPAALYAQTGIVFR